MIQSKLTLKNLDYSYIPPILTKYLERFTEFSQKNSNTFTQFMAKFKAEIDSYFHDDSFKNFSFLQ